MDNVVAISVVAVHQATFSGETNILVIIYDW